MKIHSKKYNNASLSKLLKDTFDPSKEKIADIFRPDRLRRTLDSYGDSTLEAMFGRESLLGMRALAEALDAIVIEKSAGTLVAAFWYCGKCSIYRHVANSCWLGFNETSIFKSFHFEYLSQERPRFSS